MVSITPFVNGEDADQDSFNSRVTEIEGHFDDGDDGSRAMGSPAVTSFTNAQHDHEDAAGGGQLDLAALAQSSASTGQVPLWDGANWSPATVDLTEATTKGDLIAHNGSDPTRLPVGQDGAPVVADSAQSLGLKYGGANYKFFQHVGAQAYHASNTNVTSGGTVVLDWDSEDYDSDGFHDTGTNPSRMTILNTGRHRIAYHLALNSSAASINSEFTITIKVNGSAYRVLLGQFVNVSGSVPDLGQSEFFSIVDTFSAGDYIEIEISQTASGGATIFVTGGADSSFFAIEYVGTT